MGRAPCCDKANVKKGSWSLEEDLKLKEYIDKHGTGGNWISLPLKAGLKRCGKSCRLRWLNYLRPNIKHGEFSDLEDRIICTLYTNIGSRWSIMAAQLPGRTDNDIKNYWNTKLKRKFMAANINPLPLSSLYPSPKPSDMTGAMSVTGTFYFKDPSSELVMRPEVDYTVSSDIDLNNGFENQIAHHSDSSFTDKFSIQNYHQVDGNSFLTVPAHTIDGYNDQGSMGYYYNSIEEFNQIISSSSSSSSTSSTSSNFNIDTCLFDESKANGQEHRVIYF